MHVVRLYGMEFERPGPRLRDYVRRVQGALAAAPRACRMLTEIGSQGTCGNRRLPCSRGGGGTAEAGQSSASNRGRVLRAAGPRHDRWCRVRTAIRIDGVYVDLVLGGRGEAGDVVVAAVAGSHQWPRGRRRIIIGPIGLTIWGCAGRQRDPVVLTLPVTAVAARRRSSAAAGDHRRPSNHWSSGQFPAHARPALRHRATR